MQWEDVEIGEPGNGEVRIKQTALGLNFIDVYHRKGLYKADPPFFPGKCWVVDIGKRWCHYEAYLLLSCGCRDWSK